MNIDKLLDDLSDNLEAVINDVALSKAERIIFMEAMDCVQNIGLPIEFMEKTDERDS